MVFATDESQHVRIATDTGSSPKSLFFYYIWTSNFKPIQGRSWVGLV